MEVLRIKVILILFLTSTFLLNGQEVQNLSIEFQAGLNYSDINYGNEFVTDFLRNEDYNGIGTSGDLGLGFHSNLGIAYNLGSKSKVKILVGYLQYGYEVSGSLSDLKSSVTRPLNAEIPLRVENGRIDYSFIRFGTSYSYFLNGNASSGFCFTGGINYLKYLNAQWDVDVLYETGRKGNNTNIKDVADPDLNDLWMFNLEIGYAINLNDHLSITPSIGVDVGINSIDGETLNPFGFVLNTLIARRF